MTEAEWNRSTKPMPMLNFLRYKGNNRKMRLLACACCRDIWDRFPDPCNRDLVSAVEDHSDGDVRDPDLEAAIVASSRWDAEFRGDPAYLAAKDLGMGFYQVMTAGESAFVVACRVLGLAGGGQVRQKVRAQTALVRDIFGPLPFRPVTIAPSLLHWGGGLVPRLAQAAYENRLLPSGHLDHARLAVLADALEEAGCTETELLGHLRRPGPHVRGCWGLDLFMARRVKP